MFFEEWLEIASASDIFFLNLSVSIWKLVKVQEWKAKNNNNNKGDQDRMSK